MQTWLLETLSDIFNRSEMARKNGYACEWEQTVSSDKSEHGAFFKAQREWYGAIAALEELLLSTTIPPQITKKDSYQGLILSGPAPVLSNSKLISRFQRGVFTSEIFNTKALMPSQLPATERAETEPSLIQLPLSPNDTINSEQFCLAFTADFAVVMVLGRDIRGIPAFHFSFEPEVVERIWESLRSRLLLTGVPQLERLERAIEQFTPPTPDYRLVTNFSRLLLKHLRYLDGYPQTPAPKSSNMLQLWKQKEKLAFAQPEMELLQALTHEIRTPLTTIRTITKLLLKRRAQLTPDIVKRIEQIDRECTEQIDRMELIFRAAELKTTSVNPKPVQLVPLSLEQVFQRNIPRWKKQAERRNVILDVVLPKKLPQVISDPAMLEQVLTGLIESSTRSLPIGGQIHVQVATAGNQLKLQLLSQCPHQNNALKSLGQLLVFQPETGCLSLNLDVTKNLFNILGGKLIVRQRPAEGEVLTIFLPLGNPHSDLGRSREAEAMRI